LRPTSTRSWTASRGEAAADAEARRKAGEEATATRTLDESPSPTPLAAVIAVEMAKTARQGACSPLTLTQTLSRRLPGGGTSADAIAGGLDLIHEALREAVPGAWVGDGPQRGACLALARTLS
jgi:hypothetical protein